VTIREEKMEGLDKERRYEVAKSILAAFYAGRLVVYDEMDWEANAKDAIAIADIFLEELNRREKRN